MGKPVFSDERDESVVDHAFDPIRYFAASLAPKAVEAVKAFGAWSAGGVREAALRKRREQRYRAPAMRMG